MSFGIDVDILLYASDESSPLHGKASEFLRQCAGGREERWRRAYPRKATSCRTLTWLRY